MSLYFDYTLTHSFSGLDKDDSTDIKYYNENNCNAHNSLPSNSTLLGITYLAHLCEAHRTQSNLSVTIDWSLRTTSEDLVSNPGVYYPKKNTDSQNFYTQTYRSYFHAFLSFLVSDTVYGYSDHNIRYHYVPYTFSVTCSPNLGYVEYYPTETANEVELRAIPNAHYQVDYWEINGNNVGEGNSYFLTAESNSNVSVIVHYRPNKYTLKYYSVDVTNNTTFIGEQECNYGTQYTSFTTPDLTSNLTGYAYTKGKWTFINLAEANLSNKIYCCNSSSRTPYYFSSSTDSYSSVSGIDSNMSFSNLSSTDGDILNFYICEVPQRYTITYKNYKYGKNNYTNQTNYYHYSVEKTLKTLPEDVLTVGYKFLNTSPNYWYTTDEEFTINSTTITTIPNTSTGDITVYSYQIPIEYTIYYHYYDNANSILNVASQQCTYNETYTYPVKPSDITYYYQAGWFEDDQSENLSDQYAKYILDTTNNTYTFLELNQNWTKKNYGATFSNLTTTDGDSIHYYTYYIPYAYRIVYHWTDNYGAGDSAFDPPATQWQVYMKEPLIEIEDIPDYTEYIVTDANTKNWKYYDDNNELQTNNLTYIPKTSTKEYNFYATKQPNGRIITISSNNTSLGTIEVITPIPNENTYQEGDIIQFRVKTVANECHFHSWNDGSHEFERTITVGGHNYNYIAQFCNNSTHVPGVLGIYAGTSPVRAIYQGTTLVYKGVT